ncbi:MFS transporter [Nocardia farcinica]|uniref:MFS transporter n=1 Tax=Nocardia farcinica TaxID=37329 RepID=UPI0018959369|nr:MFS transporter [Nocardia farcinica]MBF6523198.1 MFS transporter [Nocardia farcinica]
MRTDSASRLLALGALSVATLTIGLDMTVLTVALPTLAMDLHADVGALQWFSTAYTLALAALMLPAGALGDRYGRKRLLLAALVVFGSASAACAFATSSGQLIAARVVLGAAAAAMIPLSMAVLPVLFPEPGERARALSIWVTAMGLGLPLGPVLGGWLIDNFWWGSVFLINVPMVVVAAIAVAALVPESRDHARRPLDLPGMGLSTTGMLALTYGLIRCGEQGWGDPLALACVAAGLVAGAALVAWQRRATHPLIDPGLFRAPGFRWGAVFAVLISFALFGLFFTVPQYFQEVLGTDALGSGLRLLPMIGGLIVGARVGERLLPKAGVRAVLTGAMVVLALGLGWGALTGVDSPYWFTACWIALVGAGMGAGLPVAMSMALDDLDLDHAGVGTALLQAVRQAAGTLGVAALGAALATRYRSELGALNTAPYDAGVSAGVATAKATGDTAALAQVQSAFTGGMALMLWVCAAVAAAGVVLALAALPRRADAPVDASESTHAG